MWAESNTILDFRPVFPVAERSDQRPPWFGSKVVASGTRYDCLLQSDLWQCQSSIGRSETTVATCPIWLILYDGSIACSIVSTIV